MKTWVLLLVLLIVACAGAFGSSCGAWSARSCGCCAGRCAHGPAVGAGAPVNA